MTEVKSYYQLIKNLVTKHRQFILYGFIGLMGACLDFVFYILFYKLFGIPPFLASFLSVSVGIINNFFLNKYLNFKIHDKSVRRFMQFYSIGLGGAVLSSVLIVLLFNVLGIDATVAKIITIIPVVLLQFALNKKYSFGKSKK